MSTVRMAGLAFTVGVALAATMGAGPATASGAPAAHAAVAKTSTSAPGELGTVSKSQALGKGASTPTKLNARDAALMARQAPLLEAATVAISASRFQGSDIAGATIDVSAGRVDLYRTKPGAALPAGITKAGVTISVHASKFSAGQLKKAAETLQSSRRSLGDKGVSVWLSPSRTTAPVWWSPCSSRPRRSKVRPQRSTAPPRRPC